MALLGRYTHGVADIVATRQNISLQNMTTEQDPHLTDMVSAKSEHYKPDKDRIYFRVSVSLFRMS